MRSFRPRFLALALVASLAGPVMADRPAQMSRHHDSGVIIYFGSGSSHIINGRHGWNDRHGYRQGYRDGYRDGRQDKRHSFRDDRHGHFRHDHSYARPSRDHFHRSRPSARHGLTAGSR